MITKEKDKRKAEDRFSYEPKNHDHFLGSILTPFLKK